MYTLFISLYIFPGPILINKSIELRNLFFIQLLDYRFSTKHKSNNYYVQIVVYKSNITAINNSDLVIMMQIGESSSHVNCKFWWVVRHV